jgi:hypothetical protein
MTGVFQAKKKLGGGVQELTEQLSKVAHAVNYPVSYSGTDGTVVAYATGDEIYGLNQSQIVAPEFYDQVDIDAIASTPLTILVEPVTHLTQIEVIPSVAITVEATMIAEVGTKVDFNVSLEAVLGTPGTDAEIVSYNLYTNADGTININPIVRMLIVAN